MKNFFKQFNKAFTLAEVLITLVVIGVIAALTIPTAVNKYHEQQTIQALKSTYSTFAQAIKMAESNNGPVEAWDMGPADSPQGTLKLYNYLAPYLSIVKECKLSAGCFGDNYQTLQGTVSDIQPKTHSVYARAILNNGVSFLVWSNGGCEPTSISEYCGSIQVDINGDKKPNRYGYDYFDFVITKNGLIPCGNERSSMQSRCKFSGTSKYNGQACTAWVLYKNNFDYKHRDVSW